MGIDLSLPSYGGAGMGYVEYVTAIEELSRVDGSVGIIVAAHTSLCSNHIFVAGNDEQRRKYIPRLATGEYHRRLGAHRTRLRLRCRRRALHGGAQEDKWVLNGNKTFCTNGHYADVAVVHRGDRQNGAHASGSRPLWSRKERRVSRRQEREQARPAGQRHRRADLRGLRGSRLKILLGQEGDGFVDAMRVLDGGRISIAALGLGMAQGAYEAALKYSKERQQFGKAISEFQAIQWKLADMATEIDAARLLTLRAAWMKDAA